MTLAVPGAAPRTVPQSAPLPPGRTDRIAFLVGQSANGVLRHLTAEWVGALEAIGQPTDLVDVGHADWGARLGRLLEGPLPKAFVAFSGVGSDLRSSGQCLFERIRVPYVALLFDHPAYFPERHTAHSPYQALLFSDPDQLAASRAISPPQAVRGSFRFGCKPPAAAPRPLASRDIPILFARAGGDPEQVRTYWASSPAPLRRIRDDIIDVALWSDREALWDVALRRVAEEGLVSGFERTAGFLAMVMSIDTYIRRMRATRVVRALMRFDATIIGGDWAHIDHARSRATFRPACELPELLSLIDRTQVLVNLHPNNRYVPHERLIYGLQRECLVFSDASPHLTTTIGAERFARFTWDDSLEDRIADLLHDPSRQQERVSEAGVHAREAWSVSAGARSVLRAVDAFAALLAD